MSRVAEGGNIDHPGFLVEIGGEEPASLIWQHGIDTGGKTTLQVRSDDLIRNGLKRLAWALAAFHLRLATDATNPFIAAHG